MAFQSKRDWENARLAGEAARGLYSPDSNVAKYLAGKPMAKNAKSSFDQLNQQLSQNLKAEIDKALKQKGPSRDQINKAVKAGKTLEANTPSVCFSDVYYQDGICTAVFAKDNYVWEMEMSVSEFLDFAQAGSLGSYWNDEYYGT